MRIAIVVSGIGFPRGLSSTAYVGTLAEAFSRAGVPTRVVGLAKDESLWLPQTIGECDLSAPLLSAQSPGIRDRLAAAWLGILSGTADAVDEPADWYDELRLFRNLEQFAAGDADGVVMVYPRSHAALHLGHRVAERIGWKTMAFATEALTDNQIDPAIRDDYIRLVREECDGVWAVSTPIADRWVDNGIPHDRIHLSHTAVRMHFFSTQGAPQHRAKAVYLGNLVREIDYLLEITELTRRRVPEFHLTVYGDALDEARDMRVREVAMRGLSEAITIERAVAPVDVPGALRDADVLLLPRALQGQFPAEGFPQKLGEYLASGRPTVATAVCDVPTYLADGVNAYVVPPDDSQAFADAVVRVLENPEEAETVGAKGRELAADLFAADKIAERAIAFLRTLEPKPGHAAAHKTSFMSHALSPAVRVRLRQAVLGHIRRRSG